MKLFCKGGHTSSRGKSSSVRGRVIDSQARTHALTPTGDPSNSPVVEPKVRSKPAWAAVPVVCEMLSIARFWLVPASKTSSLKLPTGTVFIM